MASIVRRRGSKLWTAFFRDQNGKQHCRSTEETNKKRAQKIADEWEAAGQHKRTLRATRRVLAQVDEPVGGSKLGDVTCRAPLNEWRGAKRPENRSRADECSCA